MGLVFVCGMIALAPLIMGINIINRDSSYPFAQFAGLMTLKPLLTIPIWLYIAILVAVSSNSGTGIVLTLIPDISLTALVGLSYRGVLQDESTRQAAIWLYALDAVRWINSFFILLVSGNFGNTSPLSSGLSDILTLFAFALPTIFAIVADNLTRQMDRPQNKPKNDEESKLEMDDR